MPQHSMSCAHATNLCIGVSESALNTKVDTGTVWEFPVSGTLSTVYGSMANPAIVTRNDT